MPTRTKEHRSPAGLLWLILFLLILCGSPAFAQNPVVNSADPAETEQGTVALEVTVKGDNFGSDSEVDFLVSCDPQQDPGCDQTPSGVVAYGVKRQGPKTLKFKIDVDGAAQTKYKLDIQVRSRGRTGKGIELFRVLEKTHPNQDTTPPGEPVNLQLLEVKYGSAILSWTMPADDGYDPASGPVLFCSVNDFLLNGDPGPAHYNCEPWKPWAMPGYQQTCLMGGLDPETTYRLGVKCLDEADNTSSEAQIEVATLPYSDFQDTSWTIEAVPVQVSALIGHEFDLNGDLVIAGSVTLGNGKGRWKPVPTAIRVVTGSWIEASSSWAWSQQDVEGFANRMRIHPQGGPVFAGLNLLGPVNLPGGGITFNRELVYTFHDGAGWTTEVVAADAGYYRGIPGFAFDTAGNPAIAWCFESEGAQGGIRLARRSMGGQWTIEEVNNAACDATPGRSVELTFDDQGNPAILWIEILDPGTYPSPMITWLTRWSGTDWVEELVEDPLHVAESPGAPFMLFDSWRGDFIVAWEDWTQMEICERHGLNSWQCNVPFLGATHDSGTLGNFSGRYTALGTDWIGQDQAGELFLTYSTEASPDAALARRLPGQEDWVQEHVDHPSTRGFTGDPGQEGPFLAFDPLDLPSLSWTWDGQVYFAWKETP